MRARVQKVDVLGWNKSCEYNTISDYGHHNNTVIINGRDGICQSQYPQITAINHREKPQQKKGNKDYFKENIFQDIMPNVRNQDEIVAKYLR